MKIILAGVLIMLSLASVLITWAPAFVTYAAVPPEGVVFDLCNHDSILSALLQTKMETINWVSTIRNEGMEISLILTALNLLLALFILFKAELLNNRSAT